MKPRRRIFARGSTRPRHVRGTMNRTEKAYADHLRTLQFAGQIAWFDFESIKLRLAANTYLTPDFPLINLAGELEIHDTKGRKGESYWCEEDAKIKIKMAAAMFPFRFFIVWPLARGGWGKEEISA